MNKLYNDILELKTWIREEEGAKAEGKGQFGKIHSEKQLMDLIYAFNKAKKKSINIIWFNKGVEVIDNKVIAKARVIITNGTEIIEEEMEGLGEEKRSDMSFALGKALTYGKRFWLQKFLDLSSDDIDPEHISNAKDKKQVSKTTINLDEPFMIEGSNGTFQATSKDKVKLTYGDVNKARKNNVKFWELTKDEIDKL